MLSKIALVLATSLVGLPVTGVAIMPEISFRSAVTIEAPPAFLAPGSGGRAGMFSITSAETASSGAQTLSTLAKIPARSVAQYFASRPSAVDQLLAQPPPAQEVALWWGDLDADSQTALEIASPRLVGNLEGVPYAIRDTSNRTLLDQRISQLTALNYSDTGRAVQHTAHQQLSMLSSIAGALDSAPTDPKRTLVTLDVSGQGRAAIVLGDVTDADYVSFLVPGMFFTIENQMSYWVDAAKELYSQQQMWLDHFESKSAFIHNESVATVAWIGYDTPNLTNVGAIDNADQGRDSLAAAILGLQAQRGEDQPYIAIVAHSYGSTAAMMALSEYSFEVDALAMVGSPGSAATSVDDLNVRDNNVFVGEAAWDPIPNSSYFGPDPGSSHFGAKSLGVGGGFDVIMKQELTESVGHNQYFTPGSEAMRNFALICIDRSDLVIPEDEPSVHRTLARAP
ncbi:alpha/beta hydrolase family protein [Rhodoglobus vestalii]|uniref:Alpha/beta hydrolase family protein n=1 Tax=Rhodoglobus vestalii TaxID=193384 RepID=A0A8H2K8Q6_9MICO|nr:alpha/beta hydrolase [Rhodoglobus vestalii]TQO20939.1 alpha/beta hydrolase family protein [Rhodoglobus vestalii]